MISPASTAIFPVGWPTVGTWLANHLWQSTLFAAAAGLLTLALKKNRAQARYWLWLVASLKFLIPFSLLVGLGSYLSPSKALTQNQPGFSIVMQEVGQPFVTAKPPYFLPASKPARLWPILLLVLWCSGSVGVLLFWSFRWWRIIAAVRRALPLESGRELEAQRRLEQLKGFATQIKIATSASALEPGVVGIFHPVLLLPAGIADRLTDAQLEAIIAHELCHVRRRDNLAAALNMLVEAVFWFHPLVWWIGARLVDERERACDEEVVRLGSEPQAYAEGILKVCQFYLESPLVCVAGVTGSNLKKRIEDIMRNRMTRNLDLARKLLLITLGAVAVVAPVVIGLLNPTAGQAQDQVEAQGSTVVVALKPSQPATEGPNRRHFVVRQPGSSEWKMTGATLNDVIRWAYNVRDPQITGGPAWLAIDRYDINGKTEESISNPQFDVQSRKALQALLADRFKLTFHREMQERPVYGLVVGRNGLKTKEVVLDKTKLWDLFKIGPPGHMTGTQITMQQLAYPFLSDFADRIVVDKTGLQGVYNITLDWTWGNQQSLFAAVQDQLGLDVNPQTGPIKMFVVDHAEKPSTDQAQASPQPPSQNDAAAPAFATVSIQPTNSDHKGWWSHSYPDGRFVARNADLKALIQTAYGITLISVPDTLTSQRYDIDANAGGPAEEDRLKLMLGTLLSTRFKLASHITTKEMPVYALVVGSQGPKFRLVDTPEDKCQVTIRAPGGEAHIVGKGTLACLANIFTYLSQEKPPSLDRPVLDNTKLKGVFDFDIPVDLGAQSSFFVAVQQLGLKLDAKTAPIEVFVVDHAEEVAEMRRDPL